MNVPLRVPSQVGPLDCRHTPVLQTDVLVIGEGIAGASAALAAASAGASVTVVAKDATTTTNTAWAQGGLAVALRGTDRVDDHVADTLRTGGGLGDRDVVRTVVERGEEAVRWLVELGTEFDRDPTGSFELGREGGHGRARIVHARGDGTGAEIQRALRLALENHPRIRLRRGFTRDLIVEERRCIGAVLLTDREPLGVLARATILACGGAGQVFRETTNPRGACGDGVALAMRAGAVVRDLEFYQFHPTALYIAGAARCLVSEAVRGAGALLRDRDGTRFMLDEHPDAELAPRDVVSRAILRRMIATDDTHAYLDLSELECDPHTAFPTISRSCRAFDIDIARQPIPVRPAAHYQIGGVRTDLAGRTSVPSLFAVGESASSGLHGANRLASNSLLEGCVLGCAAGREAAQAERLDGLWPRLRPEPTTDPDRPPPQLETTDLHYSLKSAMWRDAGLLRDGDALTRTRDRLATWSDYLARSQPAARAEFELCNMLLVSLLSVEAAAWRRESRGVHYRSDAPATRDDAFRRHLEMRRLPDGSIERAVVDAARSTAPTPVSPR